MKNGSHIQVHINLFLIYVIYITVQLRKILHSGTGTAPEIFERLTEYLEISCLHRLEVGRHTRLRVLGTKNGIQICFLVKIHILMLAGNPVKAIRKLQHIVGIAGFTVTSGTIRPESTRLPEMFILTVTADNIGMLVNNRVKKGFRSIQIKLFTLSDDNIAVQCADKFRNHCVRMLAGKNILSLHDITVQVFFVEFFCRLEKLCKFCFFVEIIQTVIHTAVFDRENLGSGLLGPLLRSVINPLAESSHDFKCLWKLSITIYGE